ncbi:MAG: hypothetical protein ACMUIE_02780 [Thermoplasmatota archaeon]
MEEKRPSFIRAALITMGLYLLSVPFIIIPLIGPILAVTFVPYLASAMGSRSAHPKERLPLAFTCAFIWSAIQTLVIILVMSRIAELSPMGFRLDSIAIWLLLMIWLLNTLFTVLGALHPWKDPFKGPQEP